MTTEIYLLRLRSQQPPRRGNRRPRQFRPPVPARQGWDDPLFPGLGNGGYDVSRYTVTLNVDVEANEILGRTQIEAYATQDLSSFNLDFRGLTVTQVAVDGRPADHSRTGYELTIEPRAPIPVGTTFKRRGLLRGSAFDQLCAWNKSPDRLDKLRDRDNRVRRTLGGIALAPGQ